MMLNEELYTRIYQTARSFCKTKGLDKSVAQDITQETCIALLKILANKTNSKKPRNWSSYIKGIIVKKTFDHFRNSGKDQESMDQLNYILDKYDDADYDIIENQARNFSTLIDDFITKNPLFLSVENKKLWDLFKEQKYSNKELMQLMSTDNCGTFYSAKSRLLKKIIKIYKSFGFSHQDPFY